MKRLLPYFALLAALFFVMCSDDDVTAPENPPPAQVKAPAFVSEWGSQGSGDGEFNDPYGVACDADGNVYVADTGNQRVQKFTSDGTFILKWGSAGSGEGEFMGPSGVACDAGGNVYVTDRFNHRVQKFTSTGVFVTEWGVEGTNDGEFQDPLGIACNGAGQVVVADTYVQMFTGAGTFLGASQVGLGAYGVACDDQGYVYGVSYNQSWIRRYDASDMSVVDDWTTGMRGSDDGQFDHPTMMTFDNSRRILYVVDRDNARVQMFEPDRTFIDKWGTPGTGNGEFDGLTSIAIGAGGNVYVTDTGNHRVQVFK